MPRRSFRMEKAWDWGSELVGSGSARTLTCWRHWASHTPSPSPSLSPCPGVVHHSPRGLVESQAAGWGAVEACWGRLRETVVLRTETGCPTGTATPGWGDVTAQGERLLATKCSSPLSLLPWCLGREGRRSGRAWRSAWWCRRHLPSAPAALRPGSHPPPGCLRPPGAGPGAQGRSRGENREP